MPCEIEMFAGIDLFEMLHEDDKIALAEVSTKVTSETTAITPSRTSTLQGRPSQSRPRTTRLPMECGLPDAQPPPPETSATIGQMLAMPIPWTAPFSSAIVISSSSRRQLA